MTNEEYLQLKEERKEKHAEYRRVQKVVAALNIAREKKIAIQEGRLRGVIIKIKGLKDTQIIQNNPKFDELENLLIKYFDTKYQHQKKIFDSLDVSKLLSKQSKRTILSVYEIEKIRRRKRFFKNFLKFITFGIMGK